MAFAFIDEKDLQQRFRDATKYMLPLFEPLDEYERIARNRPHPGIAKHLPKVTDGTLAALIQEQPKRVIQEIPTGRVVATDRWLEIVGGYILSHEIIPNSNSVAALIQKCWAMTSKTLTYGAQPAFVQFVNRGEYFGTDFTLPYVKDVFLEPGKLSDRDSNVIFLRAYYQPNQIDQIIAKEQMLAKSAKGRGDTYESGWDLKVLASLKDQKKAKDLTAQTPNERNKADATPFIEIVHCFQRGIGAQFYSFSPTLNNGENVVRRKKNPDPRGIVPIHYMYANVDLSNPLGRGAVEVSGSMQNLLDSEVQMYQYNRALMLNPPMVKRGNWNKAQAKWVPNAIIDLGSDANALFEPAKIDSTAIASFPTNYGLIKSQILNLNSSTDTSVSSDAGNPGFSKTQAGVKATEQRLGVSDNYMRRQFESWFEEVMETEINLYFAERHGVQELHVDDETANRLKQLNPQSVGPNNTIRIDYDTETQKLEFKADPASSTSADNQEQAANLKELLTETSQDPLIGWRMAQDGYKYNMGEAYRELYQVMGIKNINKIITEMSEQEKQQAASQPMPMMDKPKITIAYDDLGDNPEAQQGVLQNAGVDLPIDAFQQAMQNRQQLEAAKAGPAPEQDHPIVRLMEQLDIKLTDLGPNAQQYVLQQIWPGMPADTATPSSVDMAAKASDAAVKVATLHHQVTQAENQHRLAASDSATKVAQLHQSQIAHQAGVEQQKATHELAVKQANKPQPKAGAAK